MDKKSKFIAIGFLIAMVWLLGNLTFLPQSKAATIEELQNQISVLLQQIQQLQNQLGQLQGQTGVQWCHNFNINLGYGSKGLEVKALHTALEKEGFSINADEKSQSYFGDFTASAVTSFQEKYKDEILVPLRIQRGTGYVGNSTRAKLNKIYGCGGPTASAYSCGDVNKDGIVNASDITTLINYRLGKGPAPDKALADANGDGIISQLDEDYLTTYLYKGGVAPLCSTPKPATCGDIIRDGVINQLDVDFLNAYLYSRGAVPSYLTKADVNSDGRVDVSDVITLVNYLDRGGVAPKCPTSGPLATSTINQSPIISSISGFDSFIVNKLGSWTVNASDPENKSLQYTVNWGDGSAVSQKQSSSNFTHTYTQTGIYTRVFTAYDEYGLSASKTHTVAITVNQPPAIIKVVGPSPSLAVNTPGLWTIFASDIGTLTLKYTANWGDGSAISTASGYSEHSLDFTHIYTQTGSYTITFTVYDSEGLSASKTSTINVTSPSLPKIIGNYHFDENYVGWQLGENEPVYDSSLSKNNGTILVDNSFGAGSVEVVDGIKGKAYYFNGNDLILIEPKNVLTGLDNFTIEVWVKPQAVGKTGDIINSPLLRFNSAAGGNCIYVEYDINRSFTSKLCSFNNNEWYHIALVKEGMYLKLYINGNLDTSKNIGIANPFSFAQRTFIGSVPKSSDSRYREEGFTGIIDELKIYNYAKNSFDVGKNVSYKEEVCEILSPQSGLQCKNDLSDSLESTTIPNCWMDCTWKSQKHFKRACSSDECLYNTNCYANGAKVESGKYTCTNGEWK